MNRLGATSVTCTSVSQPARLAAAALLCFTLALSRDAGGARVIAVPAPWLHVEWTEASGPVEGYAVYVGRNGGPMQVEQWVLDPTAAIVGTFDGLVEIQVAAFDADGNVGPLSPPSSPFLMVHPSGDPDGDGWLSGMDRCPLAFDAVQGDLDLDGVGDACDGCERVADANQADTDGDGIGDACECGDANGDGRVDAIDAQLIQLCRVELIQDPKICAGRCDVSGEGICDTSDSLLIQLLTAGVLTKDELSCAERP
jgi:hypothetical protein